MSYKPYLEAVSHSRAWVWQQCKTRYSLKYLLKVKPLARDASFESWARFTRGNTIHAAMESAMVGLPLAQYLDEFVEEEIAKGLNEEQLAALPQIRDDALSIAERLCEWLPITDFAPFIHEGRPVIEMPLTAPLEGWPGGFQGYIDALMVHKRTGRVVAVDYKTLSQFKDESEINYNVQLPLYLYALKHMGVAEVNNFALIQIRSTPLKRKPRKIREDVQSFDTVRISEDGCFRWLPKFMSDTEIENIWADFSKLALSMSQFDRKYSYRSRSSFSCGECEYRFYCETALSGGDVRHILATKYTTPPASLKILTEE